MIAVPVGVAALALAGCGGGREESTTPSDRQKRIGPEIGLVIVEPKPGEKVVGGTVRARIDLAGFRIDRDSVGEAPQPNTGHLHFVLDGGRFDHPRYSENPELIRRFESAGKYTPAFEEVVTYRDLPKGKHTLRVELANNDHTSAGPAGTRSFFVVE